MKHPLKPTLKTELIPILTILIITIASFYFYQNFPDQVPTHWNYKGEIDSYSGKTFGAFGFPAIIMGVYLMFLAFPYLDPKKERYQEFRKTYHIFKAMIISFMSLIYFYTGLAGLGYPVSISIVVPITVGLLFIVMGNYMSKIKRNWFIGIRTPWTISNEEVWNKTHRLGGKIFIAIGLLMIIGTYLPNELYWKLFITSTFIGVIGMMGYSYWAYQKIEKK